jgi:hypothetical protein
VENILFRASKLIPEHAQHNDHAVLNGSDIYITVSTVNKNIAISPGWRYQLTCLCQEQHGSLAYGAHSAVHLSFPAGEKQQKI